MNNPRNGATTATQPGHGLNGFVKLSLLVAFAILLASRLGYVYLADADRFPIHTIKVAASYAHVTHQELEKILATYQSASFFSLPVGQLQRELNAMPWVENAYVERIWPDTLKVNLVEKKPVARWGKALLTEDGKLFSPGTANVAPHLPCLQGPTDQQLEVLQVYKKLSKILLSHGLEAQGLQLRDNQTWILLLRNGVKVYLGKHDFEKRLLRFCKAYPAVFVEKADQLASVDLRYPKGMAVQWKQQIGQ